MATCFGCKKSHHQAKTEQCLGTMKVCTLPTSDATDLSLLTFSWKSGHITNMTDNAFPLKLGYTLSWQKEATLYHSHVTFITKITLTRSRCNFNEHVNYYARNFQMREPSKWKSACCTNMSWNWMVATSCPATLTLNLPSHFVTGTRLSASLSASINSNKIIYLQALEISRQDKWILNVPKSQWHETLSNAHV